MCIGMSCDFTKGDRVNTTTTAEGTHTPRGLGRHSNNGSIEYIYTHMYAYNMLFYKAITSERACK